MNPYGITQVDIPGVLGVYQSARQNRLNELATRRKIEREDKEYERKNQANSLLASIVKSTQPKGGGQKSGVAGVVDSYGRPSQDSGFDARLMEPTEQPQAAAEPAARSTDDMMAELAALDFDAWSKIDERQREQVKQVTSYLGNAVLDVFRLPENERAAAWSRYVQQAEASGMDIPTHLERYSPDALNQAAASAGFMEKMLKRFEPDWRFSPNGGLVDFSNPESIGAYQKWMAGQGSPASGGDVARPQSRADYDSLPPGAPYYAPDGSVRTKGGAPSQGGGSFHPGG